MPLTEARLTVQLDILTQILISTVNPNSINPFDDTNLLYSQIFSIQQQQLSHQFCFFGESSYQNKTVKPLRILYFLHYS